MDPEARRVADMIALAARPLAGQTVAAIRGGYRASRRVLAPVPDAVAATRDLRLGGVPVRLYEGIGAVPGPCLLYLHGGGWVLGDLDSHDAVCRRLANGAACRVVSVDYRLAPEHPFPAAVEDGAAAYAGLAEAAEALGVDAANIAVGGDSAGANLAAVLALSVRGTMAPQPCFQLLFYPVADVSQERPSYTRETDGLPLTADSMRWFKGQYLAGADPADWRISPLLAADLGGLPAAFVLTAGYDPLCDEGVAYAQALDEAGVLTTHLHMPNQVHGFLTMGRVIRAANGALDAAASVLRQSWRT